MPTTLARLAVVLREQKLALFATWKECVRSLPSAVGLSDPVLNDHVPAFIDEMISAIARHGDAVAGNRGGSPEEHGRQRLADGFDLREIVLEYNILRETTYDLAESNGVHLRAADCRVVNDIIDDAISSAVDAFAREQAAAIYARRVEHIAFVVHDVRTPLNAIALTTALLEEVLRGGSADTADMLRTLQRNVGRIDGLIRRVMEEGLEIEPTDDLHPVRRDIDLWPLVMRLLQDLQAVTDAADIRVTHAVPRHLTVFADAELLTRVLQNLVGNSVRFTQGGEIEIGAQDKGDGVECWVRDNGSGVAPERLSRIFEKRTTDLDPRQASFGLGLAITRQIVEAHGGQIVVESEAGQGTTFRFTIPAPATRVED